MLNIIDILHKVSCELYGYSGEDAEAAIEEFMARHSNDFNLAITDNVEESEAYFQMKYGKGQTFYFSLYDYEEGRRIATELYQFFYGKDPDMSRYSGEQFTSVLPLILFIHVRMAPISVTVEPPVEPELV